MTLLGYPWMCILSPIQMKVITLMVNVFSNNPGDCAIRAHSLATQLFDIVSPEVSYYDTDGALIAERDLEISLGSLFDGVDEEIAFETDEVIEE